MGIEDMHERRMSSNESSGHGKDYKAPKLKKTTFKVGDEVVVKGKKNGKEYVKGKVISLAQNMHIEGTILLYSDYIQYPIGMTDVFIMKRDGTRDLNGMDFVTCKIN